MADSYRQSFCTLQGHYITTQTFITAEKTCAGAHIQIHVYIAFEGEKRYT
jgi:hypothetical protein